MSDYSTEEPFDITKNAWTGASADRSAYENTGAIAIAPINRRYTSSEHYISVNWPSIKISPLPMIYQLCLVLFCSGVFLFGLAKVLEVFKP